MIICHGCDGPVLVFECDANNRPFRTQCQYDSGPFFACKFENILCIHKAIMCADTFSPGDLPLEVDPNLPSGPHNWTVVYTDIFEQTSEQTVTFFIRGVFYDSGFCQTFRSTRVQHSFLQSQMHISLLLLWVWCILLMRMTHRVEGSYNE